MLAANLYCLKGLDGRNTRMWQEACWSTLIYYSPPFPCFQGTYSIVLLAVVDSDYKFVVVDVGAYGKQSDGGVLQNSVFGKRLDEGRLELPRDLPLPGTSLSAPCVFVGDEAFQLRTDFLRPYPGRQLDDMKRIFNYRLSRARWTHLPSLLWTALFITRVISKLKLCRYSIWDCQSYTVDSIIPSRLP